MGILRIKGTIDIAQFWPIGSADADTTKIKLIVSENSFEYKKEGDTKFMPVSIFWDAISRGQVSKSVVTTSKKTGDKTITVRLQGVDTPELHYHAAPLSKSGDATEEKRKAFNEINKDRRQCFAESATVALAKHLKQFADAAGLIKAVFETNVGEPADSVDTYGRFVGNISINGAQDINLWLIENGWGHPGFYTSMTKEEIETIMDAWEKGKKKSNRPGSAVLKNANKFDFNLMYRKPKKGVEIPFTMGEDAGEVLMPKIYRRQVSWLVSKKAKVISSATSFQSYLKKKPDQLVLLKDFLDNDLNSATVLNLNEFISPENFVLKSPEDFVFKEKPGTLVNGSGKKIAEWK
ncbi:MAG: thermonuclease family protein [Ferruginibacter sp.]|nr:thermonuclease family protein [Ferruginibacter sp.]